jgi:hypothetical protein
VFLQLAPVVVVGVALVGSALNRRGSRDGREAYWFGVLEEMSGLSAADAGRFWDWSLGSLCLRVRLGLRWSMEGLLLSVGAEISTTGVGKTIEVGIGRPRASVVVLLERDGRQLLC